MSAPLQTLLVAIIAVNVHCKGLLDECRIERIKSYTDDGSPVLYNDEENRSFWTENGFEIDDDDAWAAFKRNGGDVICAHYDIKKPFCVTYNDPDDDFTFNDIRGFREKKVCRACRPAFGEYDTHSCDCDYNEYCTAQYIQWGANLQFGAPREGDVRLVNSHRICEGRVEVYHDGEWGTICDDSFHNAEAEVICRQLGYENANNSEYEQNAKFGEGVGTIWLDDLQCTGNETNVMECMDDDWGEHNCNHREDVSVGCGYCTEGWDDQWDLLEVNEHRGTSRRKVDLMQSLGEREHKWTREHGSCKRISEKKLNTKCARALTGVIHGEEDLKTFNAEELWCGELDGWEGKCYEGECHECRALHISEFTEDDVQCGNEQGSPRWCSNSGTWTNSVPVPKLEKEKLETDKTEMVLIAVSMAILIAILGTLCYGVFCSSPRMTKNGMVRQFDHAEMTTPP